MFFTLHKGQFHQLGLQQQNIENSDNERDAVKSAQVLDS